MKTFKLYYVYDDFMDDVVSVMPCPSRRAAVLSFFNAKKTLAERGYDPRLLSLVEVGDVDHSKKTVTSADKACGVVQVCTLESVESLYQNLVSDLLSEDALPEC